MGHALLIVTSNFLFRSYSFLTSEKGLYDYSTIHCTLHDMLSVPSLATQQFPSFATYRMLSCCQELLQVAHISLQVTVRKNKYCVDIKCERGQLIMWHWDKCSLEGNMAPEMKKAKT